MNRRLEVGNTAVMTESGGKWCWQLFLKAGPAAKDISKVVARLHPTFNPSERVLNAADADGTFWLPKLTGWGTFEVDLVVQWVSDAIANTTLKHELKFSRPIHSHTVDVAMALQGPEPTISTTGATGTEGGDDELASDLSEACLEPMGQLPAAAAAADGERREVLEARLLQTPFMSHGDQLFQHGRGYAGPVAPPTVTWSSTEPPRDDHSCPTWLTASEFEDTPEVAEAKCAQLARLLRQSRRTVVYTGAGISASVIGQAARSGQVRQGWHANVRTCEPTYTHYALGHLGRAGLVHSWVQQNHDGLPQKAGFPQEKINEVHGSWYDPGNPVVKYNGNLHDRAYPWMVEDAETADLVLVLGTSLGGLNADQVATNAAGRTTVPGNPALGTVMINLQQTVEDGKMTLRMFGKSDKLLKSVLRHLGHTKLKTTRPVWAKSSRVLCPYDADGKRTHDGRRMWLDLRNGERVRIAPGHNIQGAMQPCYMHIGADMRKTSVLVGMGVRRPPAVGLGVVAKRDEPSTSFKLTIEGVTMSLGVWWLEAAERGALKSLPVVNEKPVFEAAASAVSATGSAPRGAPCG